MKKLLILLTLCVANLLAGCGMVDTYAERNRRIRHINQLQARMIVDDWDVIWLQDRSANMTYWHPRIGIGL